MDPISLGNALVLIRVGHSQCSAARTLGIAPSTLNDAIKRYNETGTIYRRLGYGRKRCTTAQDDRFMVSSAIRDRFTTAVAISGRLYEDKNVVVSDDTVLRRLSEHKLRPPRPYKAPALTLSHKRERF